MCAKINIFGCWLVVSFLGSAAVADESYFLAPASEMKAEMHPRKDADFFLLIDVNAVTKDGKLDSESETWRGLHDELQEAMRKEAMKSLHARFFFARGATFAVEPKLKEELKRVMSDVDVYVIYVDMQARNDNVTWKEYRRTVIPAEQ